MKELLRTIDDWTGYRSMPKPNTALLEASGVLVDLMSNRYRLPGWKQEAIIRAWVHGEPPAQLRESVVSSDFPSLFGFTLERDVLARYQAVVPEWRAYTKVGTLPNFNVAELHKVVGNDGLLAAVPERAPYPIQVVANGHYHRQLFKYGGQFDISWEAMVNDVQSAFQDVPQRFADAVVYTEAYNVTALYAAAAGPNPLLFGAPVVDAADGANVTNLGVLPLTIGNLETTITLMAQQQDVQGKPLGIRAAHLVVPPALELTARAILTSTLKQWTEVGAGGGVPVPTANILPQMGLQLHVDPLLPVIDVSGNVNTTWYLFAEPSRIAAIQLDYLRGYENPEIVMRSSDKVSVTGAPMSPFSGAFLDDDIQYRVRCVHGGARLDPRACYAQVGP